MKDLNYWQQASVRSMLMTEQGVIAYEKDLESLYMSLLADIEKELDFVFSSYAKNGKLNYASLRNRLDDTKYKQFKAKLKTIYSELGDSILTKDFKNETKKLFDRKTITVLEYVQYMCSYHIFKLALSNSSYVYDLLWYTYFGAYCTSLYNFANGIQKDVEFIPVDGNTINSAIKSKLNKATYLEKIVYSMQQLKVNVNEAIPRCVAMGYNVDNIMDKLDKIINTRRNYDKTNVRTFCDYVNNQAHKQVLSNVGCEQYIYVAILDAVTTEECRSLDGNVFALSQAVVGVNFPPLHHNCRSSIAPYMTDKNLKKFDELETISRKNTIKQWMEQKLPESQKYIIDYISKYY